MFVYIVKRLLLMIPTFFAISLIIFLILNLAPGKPGGSLAGSAEAGEQATGSNRESYRVFKSQFNLDKPVLFNTLYSLKESKIKKMVEDIVNEDGKVPVKDIIKSQDTLEDYGQYSIPALISLLNGNGSEKFKDCVVTLLNQNAQRFPVNAYATKIDEKTRALNLEIDRENDYIKTLKYEPTDPPEKKAEIWAKWNEWYRSVESRYTYSTAQKFAIFFADTRFFKYWQNLLRFDFGISHVTKQPVMGTIISKLKYSLSLSVPSVLIAYIISVPLGVFSAVKQNSASDKIISAILFMLYSLPSFFVATILLYFFSQGGDFIKLFPTGGFENPNSQNMTVLQHIGDVMWHLVLPMICMTYASFASLSRYARTGMLDVIRSDYIRTARAKGLSEFIVIVKHAMRNGMIPIITLLGTLLPVIIGGSVIIEYIFGIPGMGLLTISSIYNRDYNIIMGIQLISALLVLIGILISDLMYALVDPRISFK